MANIEIGYSQHNATVRLHAVIRQLMFKTIADFELGRKEKTIENEWYYRQSMMNLLAWESPVNIYNRYVKDYQSREKVPFFESLASNTKTSPYPVSWVERKYGAGWVKFHNFFTSSKSFGQIWTDVAPVILATVGGLIAGGPVGAVAGAASGASAFIKKNNANIEIEKAVLQGEKVTDANTLVNNAIAADESLQASTDLLELSGPKLWAISALLLFVVWLLFFKAKK